MSLAEPDLFELIADVEARIGATRFGDSYSLYETLYEAAARLGPIGGFYVCLFDPEADSLHFAYNRDGDALEEPITLPVSSGPTSWVVRNRRPFILTESTVATQRTGITFGDRTRVSRSAVHLPMRTIGADHGHLLIGVMSAHSYEPNVYGVREIEVLQALADRAASILHDDAGHEDCRRRISALEKEAEHRRAHAARLSGEFLDLLTGVAHQMQAIVAMTPPEMPELRSAEAALNRTLHQIQAMVAEAPARLDGPHPQSVAPAIHTATYPPDLTRREMEIAVLLANGRTNPEIAAALYVSVDTVKFHCANLYRKLGVSNRVQAVQAVTNRILPAAE